MITIAVVNYMCSEVCVSGTADYTSDLALNYTADLFFFAERERGGERERENVCEMKLSVCVRVCVCVCLREWEGEDASTFPPSHVSHVSYMY